RRRAIGPSPTIGSGKRIIGGRHAGIARAAVAAVAAAHGAGERLAEAAGGFIAGPGTWFVADGVEGVGKGAEDAAALPLRVAPRRLRPVAGGIGGSRADGAGRLGGSRGRRDGGRFRPDFHPRFIGDHWRRCRGRRTFVGYRGRRRGRRFPPGLWRGGSG